MGQCVVKDCGFEYNKMNSSENQKLKEFLSERIKDKYNQKKIKTIISQISDKSETSESNIKRIDELVSNKGESDENTYKIMPRINLQNIENIEKNKYKLKNTQSVINIDTPKNYIHNYSLHEKYDSIGTPKTPLSQKLPKDLLFSSDLKSQDIPKKKQNSLPKGFDNKYFKPPSNIQSPEKIGNKVEFDNIFTEEEFGENSQDEEEFQNQFPEELIKKLRH